MKISLKWLNEYVDITGFMEKPEVLGAKLTAAGIEVEAIENKRETFKNVVIGVILKKDTHPNADKLSVCKVSTGEGVVHQIVCGAKNHKEDDRVIVALPGAVLPGNFAIKHSSIRDVESAGMLCSYKELGMTDTSDGIAILDGKAPIGKPYAEFAGLDDVVFELKVTPNRSDCLSHIGLAREVATLLAVPVKLPTVEFAKSEASTKKEISLQVDEPTLCPRYCGRALKGVKVGPSPAWLKQRLESVGLNSINNVVDVTNFVMFELGQPLHAFDVAQVKGKKIRVAKADAGETFKTLDGTEIKLKGGELTIRDGERAVALAGVVGGLNSGVTEATTDLFIESAYFAPGPVRRTSRSHGIDTDSAYRFARGVDPDGTKRAMDRACQLILQVAGGAACGDEWDIYPSPVKTKPITISIETVASRLGYAVDAGLFEKMMISLGCKVERSGEIYTVWPPSFRVDLEIEMDLVEEYARLFGYENIPEALPSLTTAPAAQDKSFMLIRRVSEIFASEGFSQAINYAFISQKEQYGFLGDVKRLGEVGLVTPETPIRLRNPLSEETESMRVALLPALFRNLKENYHRGTEKGRLFELGSVFSKKTDGAYTEPSRMAAIIWGDTPSLWHKQSPPPVFELKGALEGLFRKLGIASYELRAFQEPSAIPSFVHLGQAAQVIVEGKKVGFIGAVHPVLLSENKIRTQAAFVELDLEPFKGRTRASKVKTPSKFQAVERDLAFVMPKSLAAGDVMKSIRKAAGPLLQSLEVFDVYEGDKLEKGQKSVAFKMLYQDMAQTLTESQMTETQNKILEVVKKEFSISVR